MKSDETATEEELQTEIDEKRREIQAEGYAISIGELVNMYKDEELDIHPEFQRFFRWSSKQKSRFIESLLLGIPIPSIFVYQRRDGVWDVIDGLQRLSTILEFMGILRAEDGMPVAPSTLMATDYLTGLQDRAWAGSDSRSGLSPEQQRLIKRAAIDVKIVRRESDERSKFDLFQRLNTGGSQLSDQEVRNCLLIMANPAYYRWVHLLKQNSAFQETVAVSDNASRQQYDMELVLRFLLLKDLDDDNLRAIGDMSDFLSEASVAGATSGQHEDMEESTSFDDTFKIIRSAVGESAFRRYDPGKDRFLGGFSVSAFEAVTTGVYNNLSAWKRLGEHEQPERLQSLCKSLWTSGDFRDNSGSGVRASSRLPKIIPFARTHFQP